MSHLASAYLAAKFAPTWPPAFGDGVWCRCRLRNDCDYGSGWAATWPRWVEFHPRCPIHRKMSRRERRGIARRLNGRAGRLPGMVRDAAASAGMARGEGR